MIIHITFLTVPNKINEYTHNSDSCSKYLISKMVEMNKNKLAHKTVDIMLQSFYLVL